MTTRTGLRGLLGSSAGIAVAMAVMNLGTYAFQMLAARMLGPQRYGAIASLMAILLVVGVLQLGLQATAARRIAAEPEHVAQIERELLRVTYRAALALGALLLLLAPVVNALLRLDSLLTAALVAVTAVPLTIMGGQAGILQGELRWFPLAILYMAVGIPRVGLGVALLMVSQTESMAMVAVTVGLVAPVIVGWWALRGRHEAGAEKPEHRAREIVKETVHNSQALLAFFALSNLDVIVARNVLSGHDSGLYAGGLILTKAVLFLPQFVVIIAFPAMSTASERRRALVRSLSLVALLGAACTAGAWLLSGLAMTFVGGREFVEVQDRLWLFAVLGTALSMLQLLVYSVLARQGRGSVWFIWAGVVALIGFGVLTDSINALLFTVVAIDVTLFVVLLGLSLYRMREPLAVSPASSASAGGQ